MNLKQEGWILFIRPVDTGNVFDLVPKWGQVGELKKYDLIWVESLRQFICIMGYHKELDRLIIDDVLIGKTNQEELSRLEPDIVKATDDILNISGSLNTNKKNIRCFRNNSLIYISHLPDCIKNKFFFENQT